MTVRDNIYKKYLQGGEKYATLQGGVLPQFLSFAAKNNFQQKKILDIGCGNGKYLVYLKDLGAQVAGSDSSPTAVELTKAALNNQGDITCADMYTMEIPANTFDMIISIKTIHHGTKDEIQHLINRIHGGLSNNGQIYITLPNYESSNHRNAFEAKEEIAPGTWVPLSGPEKGLPHSFFTQEEIKQIFSIFQDIARELDDKGQRHITAKK